MTVVDVARALHITPGRVRQLDAELVPERCACGSRRYDPARVVAYKARRAAAAAELATRRAAHLAELRARRREYQAQRREQRRRERNRS